MTEKTDKKREAPYSYRPPADRREALREDIRRSGLSTNAYFTHRLFSNQPIRTRGSAVDRETLARLLAECALIRDGLDRIEAVARDGDDVSLALEGAARHLEEIAATVMKAAGRKP
jgi:hypothetical protein